MIICIGEQALIISINQIFSLEVFHHDHKLVLINILIN